MSNPEGEQDKVEKTTPSEVEMEDKELDPVAGGWNPQPDPPGRS